MANTHEQNEELRLEELLDSIMITNGYNKIRFFTDSGNYFAEVIKNENIFQVMFYRSLNTKEGLPSSQEDYDERDYRVMSSLGENTVTNSENPLVIFDKLNLFLDIVDEQFYLFGIENRVVNLHFKDLSEEE